MKRFLLSALICAPVLAQVPANPNDVTIIVGPGNIVTETVRPSQTTRSIGITRNPQDEVHLVHPMVMTSGLRADISTLPALSPGYDVDRVKETTDEPAVGPQPAFRTVCQVAWVAENDPLVYPGQPGRSHLHTGFGNTGLDAFSTADTLLSGGNSTCRGGTVNRSAYWVPSMLDTRTNKPLLPAGMTVYYKAHAGMVITDLPIGLRMITGDPGATKAQPNNSTMTSRWQCKGVFYFNIPTDQVACPPGSELLSEVFLPECWDGNSLDSPDHKAHMAGTISVKVPNSNPAAYVKQCPATHPKAIPQISFQITYVVTDTRYMRLVSDMNLTQPAGWTSHGDVIVAWKESISRMWKHNCLDAGLDCHAALLGRDADGKLKAIY